MKFLRERRQSIKYGIQLKIKSDNFQITILPLSCDREAEANLLMARGLS